MSDGELASWNGEMGVECGHSGHRAERPRNAVRFHIGFLSVMMSKMKPEQSRAVEMVAQKYLKSGDFNGLPVSAVAIIGADASDVVELIKLRQVDLVRGDVHPNPHTKAFDPEPPDVQIEKIEEAGLEGCLYPTPEVLSRSGIDTKEMGPFTAALALGAPQLSFRAFDLRALEWYRNDPRFELRSDDIQGTVIQRGGTQVEGRQVVRDGLDFFEFGFAYNSDMDRAIAAFIRYLHDLPAAQQIELSKFQLTGDYNLHPDFYRTQIIGDWPERMSIYDAFLEEKRHINNISKLIDRPPLFRTEFRDYGRPLGFGILLRPTLKEYRDFCLLLDQLLSDDMDKKFFEPDIPTQRQLTDEFGIKVTQAIGTITLLESWITKFFRPADDGPLKEMFSNFRAVRNERMKPAHKVEENVFDQEYVRLQRELINKGYGAVHTLRMVLENHPKARSYEVPDHIRQAKVWSF